MIASLVAMQISWRCRSRGDADLVAMQISWRCRSRGDAEHGTVFSRAPKITGDASDPWLWALTNIAPLHSPESGAKRWERSDRVLLGCGYPERPLNHAKHILETCQVFLRRHVQPSATCCVCPADTTAGARRKHYSSVACPSSSGRSSCGVDGVRRMAADAVRAISVHAFDCQMRRWVRITSS